MTNKSFTISILFLLQVVSYSQVEENTRTFEKEIENTVNIFEGKILDIEIYPGSKNGTKLDISKVNKDGFFIDENGALAFGYSKATIRVNKIYKGNINDTKITIYTRSKSIVTYVGKSKYTGKDTILYKYKPTDKNKLDLKILPNYHLGINCIFFTNEKFEPQIGFIISNPNYSLKKANFFGYALVEGPLSEIKTTYSTPESLKVFLNKYKSINYENPKIIMRQNENDLNSYSSLLNEDTLTTYYKNYLGLLNQLTNSESNLNFSKVKEKINSFCFHYETDSIFYNTLISTYITRLNYRPKFDTSSIKLAFKTQVFENDEYLCQVAKYNLREGISFNIHDTLRYRDIFDLEKKLNIVYNYNGNNYSKRYEDPKGLLSNRSYFVKKNLLNLEAFCEDFVFFIKLKESNQLKVIPFDVNSSFYIKKFLGDEIFLGGLNLAGISTNNNTASTLENIANATYKAIINNNGLELYSKYGITELVANTIPELSLLKTDNEDVKKQNSHIRTLYIKQRKVIEGISRLHRIVWEQWPIRYGNPVLLNIIPITEIQGEHTYCALLMEMNFGEELYFFEIRCVLTKYGWKILNNINSSPTKPKSRDYVKSLIKN